jgi:penicillin-binding protein 1C
MRTKIFITALVLILLSGVWWIFCLPPSLFEDPTCTVVNDRDGNLLSARIADDGQWRFPETDSVPERFATCLIEFEDRNFYSHPGFDMMAMGRAVRQNFRERDVVSGASTLTMQIMRMSRRAGSRSVWQKIVEIGWATRAEWRYSKDELLRIYASHAPFGGNVVGIDAAAWRYFNRPAYALTWAESAVLAVLPNAPGLIFPGRNPDDLRAKRNRLLERLMKQGHIDEETYALSLLEDLPGAPLPLPQKTPHLLQHSIKLGKKGTLISTTIKAQLQDEMTEVLQRHMEKLSQNHIRNGAVLIADIETGAVLAYIGNAQPGHKEYGEANDMVMTPRSSGSILKPFLYAQMMGKSIITPQQVVPDIPTQYAGFAPKNFDETFSGAVPADEALARSLNIPAVRMLKDYGVPAFHHDLRQMGFTTITNHPSHYGLSLILGGAETTLWDLVSAYRMLADQVVRYPGEPRLEQIHFESKSEPNTINGWPLDPASAWAAIEAMGGVNRPEGEENWESFAGAQRIAWKTGTSYGFRDAWAIGFNKKYVVGIWVGNANGEGRPGITGLNAAAPLLFDVFNRLPATNWFDAPTGALRMADICAGSGMRASDRCAATKYSYLPLASLNTKACNYCRYVHLDKSGTKQVNSDCYPSAEMVRKSYFVLPPLQEWFYKTNHARYAPLPPWLETCAGSDSDQPMHLIYPRETSRIFVPRELDGVREKVVLKAAHRNPGTEIHWHLNEQFLGTTRDMHHMEIDATIGTCALTLVDADGKRYETILNMIPKPLAMD